MKAGTTLPSQCKNVTELTLQQAEEKLDSVKIIKVEFITEENWTVLGCAGVHSEAVAGWIDYYVM